MFTSKEELTGSMGVDAEIAAFFVDRKVPENNAYWKGRYLYVARGTGYLFIPLFFDLQLKAGVPKEILLNEQYVQLMERILDKAALFESEKLDFNEHIRQIDELVKAESQQPELLNDLREYFSQQPLSPVKNIGTENPALNRGDALLYLLTTLTAPEETINKVIEYWKLLVPTFLFMDDLMDLHEDQEKKEENALSIYGYDSKGVHNAIEMIEDKFRQLEAVNPELGTYFRNSLEEKKRSPYFQIILKD
jgi:hypothetical protein